MKWLESFRNKMADEKSSKNAINKYGDVRSATVTGHGVDIASQRTDDLDKKALAFIKSLTRNREGNIRVLDVGCGPGGQAVRMVQAGASVTALDMVNYSEQINTSMRRAGLESGLEFRQAQIPQDIDRRANPNLVLEEVSIIFSQRMIHYLPLKRAQRALAVFRDICEEGGRLYLSASGLTSELSDGYKAKNRPLANRFGLVSKAIAEKHAIYQPVCLYTLDELATEVEVAGWQIEEAFLSPFGNVKIVASTG